MTFKLSLFFLLLSVSLFGNANIYDPSLFTKKEIDWLKKTKILKYSMIQTGHHLNGKIL